LDWRAKETDGRSTVARMGCLSDAQHRNKGACRLAPNIAPGPVEVNMISLSLACVLAK
jgi:hypothetical protein